MTPAYAAIRTPADLEGHLLLASETCPRDLVEWLEQADLPHLAGARRQLFDYFFITR